MEATEGTLPDLPFAVAAIEITKAEKAKEAYRERKVPNMGEGRGDPTLRKKGHPKVIRRKGGPHKGAKFAAFHFSFEEQRA